MDPIKRTVPVLSSLMAKKKGLLTTITNPGESEPPKDFSSTTVTAAACDEEKGKEQD